MNSLFIGRFQPFHLGHLQVVKRALKQSDYLIIAIGSALDNFKPDNPFSASERWQMIKNTLSAEKINPAKYCIVTAPNIHNYALWVWHLELILPPFEKIYTGSALVKKLFEEVGKYRIEDIKKELNISATKIRDKIIAGNKLDDLLHPEVIKFLKKIKAKERLEAIKSSIPFA